jgi:hypothetical protein
MTDTTGLSPAYTRETTSGLAAGGGGPRVVNRTETRDSAESPKKKFKTVQVTNSSQRTKECSVVSQTLSIGGKVKDGLSAKVKSEMATKPGGSNALFAPDKVRVKTEKTVSSPAAAKVKIERNTAASQKLKSPVSGSEVQGKQGEESVSKKSTIVSRTISGGSQKMVSSPDKPRKKPFDHTKRRILESEESSDSDDDAPLVMHQTSVAKDVKPSSKRPREEDSSSDNDDEPLAKKSQSPSVSGGAKKPSKTTNSATAKSADVKAKKPHSDMKRGAKSVVNLNREIRSSNNCL